LRCTGHYRVLHHGYVEPTVDTFRALARSSPWRWRTLHFSHRDGMCEVEAWVRRPLELLVRRAGERDQYVTGVPYTVSSLRTTGDGPIPEVPERRVPQAVEPTLRADGLVAERPAAWWIDYDDPMYQNFSWVAMLDPVELSHDVRVEQLRVDTVAGRDVWRAFLVAEPGYDPRCGGNCCELLYSEAGLIADFADDPEGVPEDWRGRRYPDGYDVALDVGTGVVVRCRPVGGDADAPWLENDIHEVDADLDAVFAGRVPTP
jgi:hypothetical protein